MVVNLQGTLTPQDNKNTTLTNHIFQNRINPEFKDQRRSRDGQGQMFDKYNGAESLNSNIIATDIVPMTPS